MWAYSFLHLSQQQNQSVDDFYYSCGFVFCLYLLYVEDVPSNALRYAFLPFYNTNRVNLAHNAQTVYSIHTQNDSALFINISTL